MEAQTKEKIRAVLSTRSLTVSLRKVISFLTKIASIVGVVYNEKCSCACIPAEYETFWVWKSMTFCMYAIAVHLA